MRHKIGRDVNLTAHLHLVPRLRISRITLHARFAGLMSLRETKLPAF